jgi:hypothetical protein
MSDHEALGALELEPEDLAVLRRLLTSQQHGAPEQSTIDQAHSEVIVQLADVRRVCRDGADVEYATAMLDVAISDYVEACQADTDC